MSFGSGGSPGDRHNHHARLRGRSETSVLRDVGETAAGSALLGIIGGMGLGTVVVTLAGLGFPDLAKWVFIAVAVAVAVAVIGGVAALAVRVAELQGQVIALRDLLAEHRISYERDKQAAQSPPPPVQ